MSIPAALTRRTCRKTVDNEKRLNRLEGHRALAAPRAVVGTLAAVSCHSVVDGRNTSPQRHLCLARRSEGSGIVVKGWTWLESCRIAEQSVGNEKTKLLT